MTGTDPVLAELVLLRQTVATLNTQVAVNNEVTGQLQRTLADVQQNAVPRREWELGRAVDQKSIESLSNRVGDIEEDADDWTKFKRTMLLGVALAAFSAVISVAIAVVGLLLGSPPT